MNLADIKEKAVSMGIKPGKMKKGELIRTIQTAEGNTPCFDTGEKERCGQDRCLWRDDCR